MGYVDQLKPANNLSDLEHYTLHAVREVLRGMNVYHSPWQIVIEQKAANALEITAWIPEKITLPHGLQKPVVPVHFLHAGGIVMRDFTDVEFWPIARELAKEMQKAFQLGINYGRS